MENFNLLFTIIGIHIFAWLTPGPNIIIIRNSLIYSKKIGILTAVGMALSNIIHISYVITGLGILILKTQILFKIIKYAGIIYLSYLGIKTFFIKKSLKSINKIEKNKKISNFNAIKIGFLTNLLSPKAPLFFISIFTLVMSSKSSSWVIIALWVIMPLTTFLMASLHSIIFSHKKIQLFYRKNQTITNKILGGLLLLLALRILFYNP